MRDINRINDLYTDLRILHKKVPDLRFMQLMMNFIQWHTRKYRVDPFYTEDNVFLDRFRDFIDQMVTK